MRVLSIATLFPNPVRPSFGVFVGNQMRTVVAGGEVDLAMVSPLGLPPWPLSRLPAYDRLRAIPMASEAAGLPVHYPRFTVFPMIGGDSNPRRIARAVLALAEPMHRAEPFDLVDAQFFFPDGPAAAIVAHRLGLPLTIKARGADIHYWSQRPNALRQMRGAAEQATRLLAVSEALRADMVALGMAADKTIVHYTGLDRERFHPTPREDARAQVAALSNLAIPTDGPLLVTPGALIARKGQAIALSALAQIADARLAFAGAGPDEARLRRLAGELGVADRVHLLGIVDHERLPLLLSAADVVVLPSASEGLANAWVEALSCGTPLVIPDVGGASELISDASAGRLVARDADAIAGAVRAILADPPSQAAVAQSTAGFSWEANAQKLVAIWRNALADAR